MIVLLFYQICGAEILIIPVGGGFVVTNRRLCCVGRNAVEIVVVERVELIVVGRGAIRCVFVS